MAYPALKEQFPSRWKYIHAKRGVNRLFLHRQRLGGQPYRANHSFYGYYERFWEKNPKAAEHWVEKRPDYFAKGYRGQPPQMCFTDPGFVKQAIADARDYFDGEGAKSRAVVDLELELAPAGLVEHLGGLLDAARDLTFGAEIVVVPGHLALGKSRRGAGHCQQRNRRC